MLLNLVSYTSLHVHIYFEYSKDLFKGESAFNLEKSIYISSKETDILYNIKGKKVPWPVNWLPQCWNLTVL